MVKGKWGGREVVHMENDTKFCCSNAIIHNTVLDLVVQKVDSAIQWISSTKTNCIIHWVVIYPVDSTIHLLKN